MGSLDVVQQSNNQQVCYQNVVIMRHGDRIDYIDEAWASKATCKWDPELSCEGRVRAFSTGKQLRAHLGGVPINRAFVSPFLRCLETAAEVVSALSATGDGDEELSKYDKASDGVTIDPSKIKVAVEYGLCEMMNTRTIKQEMAPEDGEFIFDNSMCESVLPGGTIDHSVEPVYKEMPKWEEKVEDSLARYVHITMALSNKYPSENLLLVTHALGVFSVRSKLTGDTELRPRIDYCGYLHGRRAIYFGENQSFTAGPFEVVSQNGIIIKDIPQGKA